MGRNCVLTRGLPGLLLLIPLAAAAGTPAAERRNAVIGLSAEGAKALPQLIQALDDANPLVRRAAARGLSALGDPAQAALRKALGNSDPLVRRTALKGLCRLTKADPLPVLGTALDDAHPLVRQCAVSRLVTIRPQTKQISALLERAGKDEVDAIRAMAVKALWPFHRDNVSIRDRHYDHDVQVAQTIRLPKEGWRFRLDPKRDGHNRKWFAPRFADAKWRAIAIEQAWQKAGVDYIGVAWYRRWIDLPPKPRHLAAELHFQGVDESAWVWVNGTYVGQHDVGPQGWNLPFRLDVTKELKWGERNHVTVRAMNTAHAGGIWRPVELEVLR